MENSGEPSLSCSCLLSLVISKLNLLKEDKDADENERGDYRRGLFGHVWYKWL